MEDNRTLSEMETKLNNAEHENQQYQIELQRLKDSLDTMLVHSNDSTKILEERLMS